MKTSAEKTAEKVWKKGALHTHTLWSDGRSLPETAVKTYKNLGYDFVCITDHNVFPDTDLWLPVAAETGPWPCNLSGKEFNHAENLMNGNLISKVISFRTYVRLRTVKELQELFDEEDKFLVLPGEEITLLDTKFEGKPGVYQFHFNIFNLSANFLPLCGKTGDETVKLNYRQYLDAAQKSREKSFFTFNHPYAWAWDVDPILLIENPEITHFEICNNGSAVPVKHIFTAEKFWDFVLAHRLDRGNNIIYGTASDDAHFYIDAVGINSGNDIGWVMVNCPGKMTGDSLAEALIRGDFYSSTGVVLEDVELDRNTKTLSVKIKAEENVKYQIKFIVTKKDFDRSIVCKDYPMDPEKYTRRLPVIPESIGITALSVDGCSASYTLKEDDLYVRALIISDKKTEYDGLFYPETEQAWTQPLANGK